MRFGSQRIVLAEDREGRRGCPDSYGETMEPLAD
jgi:hypothetical protein